MKPFASFHSRSLERIDTASTKGVVINFPSCSGPCNQKGGEHCPTPSACQIPLEEAGPLGWWARIKRHFHELVADVESWR